MSDCTLQLRVVSGVELPVLQTLELIESARQSLVAARSLPDIRRVMEMASVAKDAAKRAAKLAEAERRLADTVEAANDAANDAAAIRNEAQAKAGELLKGMAERGERDRGHGDRRSDSQAAIPKLGDLGVAPSESSRWQQVAAVPPDVRQEYVEETKAERGEVSTAGLLRWAADRVRDPLPQPGLAPRQPLTDDPPEVVPAINGDELHEALWNLVFEMQRVWSVLERRSDYRLEELVEAIDVHDRAVLLMAAGELEGRLADLNGELIRRRAGEEANDPPQVEAQS
jgi:hypothetical protein